MTNQTTSERTSDRELVVTRTFDAPARLVFKAWTDSALFARWWVPKSLGLKLLSCEVDARKGGKYRLVFDVEGKEMPFFGTYLDVVAPTRLQWTNEEEGPDTGSITTLTLAEKDGKTHMTMHDQFRSKEALDAAIESGSTSGNAETFQQLEDLLPTLA